MDNSEQMCWIPLAFQDGILGELWKQAQGGVGASCSYIDRIQTQLLHADIPLIRDTTPSLIHTTTHQETVEEMRDTYRKHRHPLIQPLRLTENTPTGVLGIECRLLADGAYVDIPDSVRITHIQPTDFQTGGVATTLRWLADATDEVQQTWLNSFNIIAVVVTPHPVTYINRD